ncbi:Hypothetical predicted protein [Pelobates cultripes]|uniref:Uncharacterized protein n=1 Tax=Pelobates cultripes TaxID=61616 RepID=A0AAD1RW65_PELCU|nr:Hypothetical predicted protein [Pelobates cultripes]
MKTRTPERIQTRSKHQNTSISTMKRCYIFRMFSLTALLQAVTVTELHRTSDTCFQQIRSLAFRAHSQSACDVTALSWTANNFRMRVPSLVLDWEMVTGSESCVVFPAHVFAGCDRTR